MASEGAPSDRPPSPSPSPAASMWQWQKIIKDHRREESSKPAFAIVPDDSKPLLRDPLLTSDPIETEQILLQPPPFHH
eukprot:c20398_g1_i1 orf=51-284(+)